MGRNAEPARRFRAPDNAASEAFQGAGQRMKLFLKVAVFTVVMPGTFAVLLPVLIAGDRTASTTVPLSCRDVQSTPSEHLDGLVVRP